MKNTELMKELNYQRTFTEEESVALPQNHYEEGEELRWVVNWSEGQLDFIRWRSGICIFRVFLKKEGSQWVVEKAYVNTKAYTPPKWEDPSERLDKLFSALIFKRPYHMDQKDILNQPPYLKASAEYLNLRKKSFDRDIGSAFMNYHYLKYIKWKRARKMNPFANWFIFGIIGPPEDHWLSYQLKYNSVTKRALPAFNNWKEVHRDWIEAMVIKYEATFAYMIPRNVFAEFYGTDNSTRKCSYCELIETEDLKLKADINLNQELCLVCDSCNEMPQEALARHFVSEFEVTDYEAWDHLIFEAANKFHQEHNAWPTILTAHPETLEAFDNFMNEKLFREGRITEPKQITHFSCSTCEIKICVDFKSPARKFRLVLDDKANFVKPDESA